MIKSILKKLRTLRNLNWKWAYNYYKKRARLYAGFYFSKLRGRKFWEVDVDGLKVKLSFSHPYQHLFAKAMNKGIHERVLLSLWKKNSEEVHPGDLIFDFGAYNGIYGLVAAAANPDAHVVIVEPDPVNIAHIEANILLNNLKNATALKAAVAERSGTVRFKLHDGATAGKMENSGEYEVPAFTVDELVKKSGRAPALMKFDVVGAESAALLAAKETLSCAKRLNILLEFYPASAALELGREDVIWPYMKSLGYTSVFLYPRGDGVSKYYYVFKNEA